MYPLPRRFVDGLWAEGVGHLVGGPGPPHRGAGCGCGGRLGPVTLLLDLIHNGQGLVDRLKRVRPRGCEACGRRRLERGAGPPGACGAPAAAAARSKLVRGGIHSLWTSGSHGGAWAISDGGARGGPGGNALSAARLPCGGSAAPTSRSQCPGGVPGTMRWKICDPAGMPCGNHWTVSTA